VVDEWQLFLSAIFIRGGNAAYPASLKVNLHLVEQRRFHNGTVFLRYGSKS
jgi:hypothetical protein